jgi:tRNA threonylcarbamoyladenosine biosynthesis protein TsaB
MSARLLALDSSTETLSVAVAAADRQWVRNVQGGALASSRIIGLALEGLAGCGLQVAQLDAVAFGAGPGAFTGLRCACAVAQGLAFAAAKPVLAIDSLMIVAEGARGGCASAGGEVWVAMDARMDEIYAAQYRLDGQRWQVVVAPALYTLPALAARWSATAPRAVAGNAVAVLGERLPLHGAVWLPDATDRASALLALTRQAHGDGLAVDPAQASPLYLRDKVALTTLEREAARRASTLRRPSEGQA